jgi:CBS domain-containing protein
MCNVHELIKDRQTYWVDANQTVLEVARFMVERNIGAVAVLRNKELAGIFSERDIMKRVVAERRDPGSTKVADVMTPDPLTVSPSDSLEDCRKIMGQHGFRHIPICDGKQLKGLLSMRDILLQDLHEKDDEVKIMRAYIHSGPPAE